jgi:PAS domain S-box-containing protein
MLTRALRILLVEDNPGDARLIREMLRDGYDQAHELAHVDRLSHGLDRLQKDDIDVVLLDLSLPDAQGLDGFARMHAISPEIPIVVLTGLEDGTLATQAVQQGAQDYIPKSEATAHSLVRSLLYGIERARGEAERARLLASEQAARAEAEAQRAEAEGQRARLRAILESAGHGILFVNATTGYVTANPAANRLFGRDFIAERGLEQNLGLVFHPDGQPTALENLPLQRSLRGEGVTDEELLIGEAGGVQVPVLVSSQPVRDSAGRVVGAVEVLQDITAIKELERTREEWTSVIAHDLRQPVAAISFYAQALAATRDDQLERVQQRATTIVDATRRLDRMIADLLDVSRLGAGQLRIEPVPTDFGHLVRRVIAELQESGENQDLRIHAPGAMPTVQADPGRLEQVIVNLVSNAMKYGTPGTPVSIDIAHKAGTVEVSVTNEGPGIPEEEVSRLFSRFYRAHAARASGVAGLGLGLYITRELVRAHGGRISVESKPGRTTTFRFTVPTVGSPTIQS